MKINFSKALMPISVKTMRDIWLDYLEFREKSLAKIRKYFLDYLERKKYATEIFGFIEKDLGDAGFSKV